MNDRKERRAARRRDISGSGPTRDSGAAHPNPGARGAGVLFGEVMLVGLLVAGVGFPLVTLPAAIAAGARHLRRFVRGDESAMASYWRDLRTAIPTGVVVGLAVVVASAVLFSSLWIASTAPIPGRELIVAVAATGVGAVGVLLLAVASRWTPERGWRGAWRQALGSMKNDPIGAAYIAAAVGLVVLLTWVLPPLVIPALGCAVLAAIAIPGRRRGR